MVRKCLEAGSNHPKYQVHRLHPKVTADELQPIFELPPSGARKVVIATDIAETNLTINDVLYVIDFCRTKLTSPGAAFVGERALASQAKCLLRRSRAGRVRPGRYFRLVPHAQWDLLPEHVTP